MPTLEWPDMLIRLLIGLFLGVFIGLEREAHDRPAGLRTHALVSLGACVFMLASRAVAGEVYDPGRIAAGIVTGIGFLGAGTIMRHGNYVTGLTTAASIWCAAAIGIAVGIGWIELAVVAALLVFLALRALRPLAEHVARDRSNPDLRLVVLNASVLGALTEALEEVGSEVRELRLEPRTDRKQLSLMAAVSVPSHVSPEVVLAVARAVEGVVEASWAS